MVDDKGSEKNILIMSLDDDDKKISREIIENLLERVDAKTEGLVEKIGKTDLILEFTRKMFSEAKSHIGITSEKQMFREDGEPVRKDEEDDDNE